MDGKSLDEKLIIVTLTQFNIICYNQIQIHDLINYFIHFQLKYNIIHPSLIILTEILNIFSFKNHMSTTLVSGPIIQLLVDSIHGLMFCHHSNFSILNFARLITKFHVKFHHEKW
jgi:hypothetical protein